MKTLHILCSITFIIITMNVNAQNYSYDFSNGYDGWSGDFADYPISDTEYYLLEFNRTTLPTPLNTNIYALKINGKNLSDDLFMFIKRKITGLNPNTTYQLLIDVEFASNVATNLFGIGGAPGEGVIMKVGASIIEPVRVNSNGYYIMNIDKGNQTTDGVDMNAIGHIGVSDTTTEFTLINRNNAANLFSITTDVNGEVWICIGTDSGFEGTTTLYYNRINLTFSTVLDLPDFNDSQAIKIYPNPTSELITVEINQILLGKTYKIIDQAGHQIASGKLISESSNINLKELPVGMYFLKIGEQINHTFKILKN